MARSETEVPAGFSSVSVIEVAGLFIDILTGGIGGGLVLTTWKETCLDRYLECGNLKEFGQSFTLADWAIYFFFLVDFCGMFGGWRAASFAANSS